MEGNNNDDDDDDDENNDNNNSNNNNNDDDDDVDESSIIRFAIFFLKILVWLENEVKTKFKYSQNFKRAKKFLLNFGRTSILLW